MVRNFLMQKFNLKVDEKEIHDAAQAYVAYQYAAYGMGNVPENLLKDENTLHRIIENVEAQKVIESVKGAVSLDEDKVSVEKFREL